MIAKDPLQQFLNLRRVCISNDLMYFSEYVFRQTTNHTFDAT